MSLRQQQQQQGVALITAVLIVALVTITAVAMASRQQFDVRRSGNIFNSDQAWLAALGGEDYARNVLAVDKDFDVDHLEETWAEPVVFPFEGMTLSGQIVDMQGRFNLNNLVENGEVNQKDLARFKNLLKVLDLEEMFRPITKYSARLLMPEVIPEIIRKAFKQAQMEKSGACFIEFPENIAEEKNYIPRPDSRPLTKFEKRGHRLGHGVWDLMFIRKSS